MHSLGTAVESRATLKRHRKAPSVHVLKNEEKFYFNLLNHKKKFFPKNILETCGCAVIIKNESKTAFPQNRGSPTSQSYS